MIHIFDETRSTWVDYYNPKLFFNISLKNIQGNPREDKQNEHHFYQRTVDFTIIGTKMKARSQISQLECIQEYLLLLV